MPISHRGFSAWIYSDDADKPLNEEFLCIDEEKNVVTCWIPGKAGNQFTVCWQDHAGRVDTCSYITIDGLCVPGRFLLGNGVAVRSGVRISDTAERPFVFKDVLDDGLANEGVPKDAGSITLMIKRVKRVDAVFVKPLQALPPSVLGKRKIGDISIQLGEKQQYAYMRQPSTYKVVPYEDDAPPGSKPKTFVTFIFRYRSPESLNRLVEAPEPLNSEALSQVLSGPQHALDFDKIITEVAKAFTEQLSKRQKLEHSFASSTRSDRLSIANQCLLLSSTSSASIVSTTNNSPSPLAAGSAVVSTGNDSSFSTSSSGILSTTNNSSSPPILPGPPAENPAMNPPYVASGMQYNAALINGTSAYPGMPYMYPHMTYGPPHPSMFPPTVSIGSQSTNTATAAPECPPSLPAAAPPRKTSKAKKTVARKASKIASTPPANAVASTSRSVSASNRLLPPGVRRASADSKRAASWTAESSSASIAAGPYASQSEFLLPRNTLQSSTLMNLRLPDDSETSESPEASGQD